MNSIISNWQSRPVRTLWFVVGGLILVSLEILLAFAVANWQMQLFFGFFAVVALAIFFWRPEMLILFYFGLALFLPGEMHFKVGIYLPSTFLGEANFVVFDFILFGTLFIWLIKMLVKKELKLERTAVDLQMGVLFLVVVVGFFVSLIKDNYLVGIFRDLRVFVITLFYFYFTVSVIKDRSRLIFFLKMAGILIIVFAGYQVYLQSQVGFPTGAKDNIFHQSTFMWYLWSFAILVCFGLFRKRKVVYFLAAMVPLLFVFFSYSKVWMVALIVGIIVSTIVLRRTLKPKALTSTALVVVMIGVLVLALIFVLQVDLVIMITDPVYKLLSWQQESTVLWRTAQMKAAWAYIVQDPIFGGGLGAFYQFAGPAGGFFEAKAATIENDYWWVLFRLGFLGLGAFIWLIASVLRRGSEALKHAKDDFTQPLTLAFLNCFVFLLCFFMGGSILTYFRYTPTFAVMAGLIVALDNITKPKDEEPEVSLATKFTSITRKSEE